MKTILHLSCDFPDQISHKKTKAVYNLVSNASNFKHIVISLNRTANPLSECIEKEAFIYSVGYWGLPYGVLLNTFLIRTAERLFKMIKADQIQPTLIHCHKLSFEGVIGYYLAKKLSVPYVCTVRGDSDLKLIKYKKS